MYKLKQELPKEFKIKVTPEQSEALQLHLFSIGVKWASGSKDVKFTERLFLYRHNCFFCKNDNHIEFKDHRNERIKFKDYFEKVEEKSFPEKWCILVTEENYQELNTWMHRNWKNYELYSDKWYVDNDNLNDSYFYSHGIKDWNIGLKCVFFQEITTEQFRAQYGSLNETKAQGTKVGSTEINGDDFVKSWIESALNYQNKYKKLLEENKVLRNLKEENENLKAQINILTKDLGHYYNLKKSIKILINEQTV